MPQLPLYLSLAFILITVTTIAVFYTATNRNKTAISIVLFWVIFQSILAYYGFFNGKNIQSFRIISGFAPAVIVIIFIVLSKRTAPFMNSVNIAQLTILHSIRIPVELVLYGLFIFKAIPEIMTFEGKNYDILAGISAPIIYYMAFYKKKLNKDLLLAWNFISLFLLLNIVVYAVLSLELPFQKFGLDQPNQAIRYFPFNLLPSVVVPIVLFAHLATIKRLIKKDNTLEV